jgi:hypothetical protein
MNNAKRRRGFLSYAHEDRAIANKLYDSLFKRGITLWYDQQNFRQDQSVDAQILNAIKESYFLVLLLTHTSVSKRGYIRKEIRLALDMQEKLQEGRSFLIPVRADECQPLSEEIYGMSSFVDLFNNWDDGISQIVRLIPIEGQVTDLSELSPLETQARICSSSDLPEIAKHLINRNEIKLFMENALRRLAGVDNNLLSRKSISIQRDKDDFATCLELHFVHDCGSLDPKTTCNRCGAVGSIIHGTIEMGGYSQSDYNDNYIVWCTECFSADYDFEIDYNGTGPLRFDYDRNVYL